jgi:hypothetical protein
MLEIIFLTFFTFFGVSLNFGMAGFAFFGESVDFFFLGDSVSVFLGTETFPEIILF